MSVFIYCLPAQYFLAIDEFATEDHFHEDKI